MKKILQIPYILILTFLLLFTALPGMAAGQNGGEQRSGGSVTKIDLGIRELTMEVGGSYTFRVTFEPENTAYPYLRWYSSDESVIRIDGLSFTVTALAPGNAVIYAESLDSVSHAVCSVQVSGAVGKDAADLISGGRGAGPAQRNGKSEDHLRTAEELSGFCPQHRFFSGSLSESSAA